MAESVETCDKLALAFEQCYSRLSADSRMRMKLIWEATVSAAYVRPSIYRHDETPGFTEVPKLPEEAKVHLAARAQSTNNPLLVARYSDYLQEVGRGEKYRHAIRAVAVFWLCRAWG